MYWIWARSVLWAEWNIKVCLRSHRWVGQANFGMHIEVGSSELDISHLVQWARGILMLLNLGDLFVAVFLSHTQGLSTTCFWMAALIIFLNVSGPNVLVNPSVDCGFLNYFINTINIANCNKLSQSNIPETEEPARHAPANDRVWMYCSRFHQ